MADGQIAVDRWKQEAQQAVVTSQVQSKYELAPLSAEKAALASELMSANTALSKEDGQARELHAMQERTEAEKQKAIEHQLEMTRNEIHAQSGMQNQIAREAQDALARAEQDFGHRLSLERQESDSLLQKKKPRTQK